MVSCETNVGTKHGNKQQRKAEAEMKEKRVRKQARKQTNMQRKNQTSMPTNKLKANTTPGPKLTIGEHHYCSNNYNSTTPGLHTLLLSTR